MLDAKGILEALSTYRNWVVGHYQTRRKLTGFDFDPEVAGVVEGVPTDHALSSSIYHDGEERVVRIQWSYPDDSDAGLRWLNEVRIGQFGDRCSVEHLILIESVEYSISPARLLFGSPRAVREICTKNPVFIGKMQVKAEPYPLAQDGISDLLALLTSDLRKLPVVMLSPYAHGEPNRIDPVKLAQHLAGMAVVVRVDNPEITWDFADEVGRQLSCFNGAARIYWPGFSKNSDPRSHRLFFGTWIDQVGPDTAARIIERAIFAVAAFRYVSDRRISGLIRRVDAAERQKILENRKATGDGFWEDYERDLARLDEAERLIDELKAENANLKANQEVFFAAGAADPGDIGDVDDGVEPSFSSVVDATMAAGKRCKNLEVLDSALVAAGDSPFQRPYDIYKALTDLHEIVDAWQKNRVEKGSGGDLLQHLRDRGWGKRSSMHISDTTRGKFRAHYEFDYNGKKQIFEPHITIGSGDPNNCASIHFIFDQDNLKIIVGHVGKHLPNTKT
ncbi:hypothetical protein GAY31_13710 [Azospirillum brasilense]|nr:hypothetical protein [Azospirillum brasilense]